jgi:pyruvate formate lyase activating enzyme
MTPEALKKITPYLHAANVDLKAFNPDYYKNLCGAKLEPVKETLKRMKSLGVFVEVTTLLIPGLNDDKEELKALCGFLADSLGPETPWHVSRFHPTYKLTDRPSTPVETLMMARDIGMDSGLRYVYTGNVPGEKGEDTLCYQCGKVVIKRWGFQIRKYEIKNGCCKFCGAQIDGVDL